MTVNRAKLNSFAYFGSKFDVTVASSVTISGVDCIELTRVRLQIQCTIGHVIIFFSKLYGWFGGVCSLLLMHLPKNE